MRHVPSRRYILLGSIVLAILIAGILALALRHNPSKPYADKTVADTKSTQNDTTPSKDAQSKPSTASTDVSDADKQATAAGNARPITDACKLLTVSAAKQVVGINAHAVTATSTSSLKTSNSTLTSCAFTGQNGTVQLVIRKPSGRLGIAENGIEFGSGRPAGAAALNGYGQAAYWNPSNKTLNVLGDNNWYIISRNSHSQADTEAAAKLLAPGF